MEPTSSRRALVEPLESRTLLTASLVGQPRVTNASRLVGPQQDETVAVNPTNPLQMFLIANNNNASLMTATSSDGGDNWVGQTRFDGSDGLPPAQNNASAAYDSFGNLYVAYHRADSGSTAVLFSYDNGQTFHVLANVAGVQTLPVLATGDNTLWLGLQQSKLTGNPTKVGNSGAVAYAAKITGPGRIGALKRVADISGVNSYVESLAVGPSGQVVAAYQYATESGPTVIYTRTDPDGLGPRGFTTRNSQVTTEVGTMELIPVQPNAGINAGASLAFDDSSDAFTGRVYMAYTSAPSPTSANQSIYLVYSDNSGVTWSTPQRVNDDTSANSHIMPQVAVDPVTGTVAVTWYDARNDNGIPGIGGTDNNTANNDVQVYGAVGTPSTTGVSFSPNFVIQRGYSNAADILQANGAPDPNQFGLHNGIAFYNGRLVTAWADNSNSTGDNADGTLNNPDVYAASMTIQTVPAPSGTLIGSFGSNHGAYSFTQTDGAKLTFQVSNGQGYVFQDSSGALKVRVSGTTANSALSITSRGGAANLSDVVVNGPLGSINAPGVTLTGSFTVQGRVKHATLGSVAGGTFAAGGGIGNITVGSLTNASVLAGALPGADLVFAGASDTDDTFQSASIDNLIVNGGIQNSIIGAGVNPVDGVFGNGNDTIISGASSRIGSIRAGSADSASRFEAGAFGAVKLPDVLNSAVDPRFLIG